MNFYYTDHTGAVVGPVGREQLQKLVDSGQVVPDSQACLEGSEDWRPLSALVRPTPKAVTSVPKAKRAQSATSPPTPKQTSPRGAATHLRFIRDKTCYEGLRFWIDGLLALSVIGAIILIVSGVGNGNDHRLAVAGVVLAALAVPSRHYALLLIDIADTLLNEHSKDRNDRPPS